MNKLSETQFKANSNDSRTMKSLKFALRNMEKKCASIDEMCDLWMHYWNGEASKPVQKYMSDFEAGRMSVIQFVNQHAAPIVAAIKEKANESAAHGNTDKHTTDGSASE